MRGQGKGSSYQFKVRNGFIRKDTTIEEMAFDFAV